MKGIAKAFVDIKSGGVTAVLAPNIVTLFFDALKGIKREQTLEFRAWLLVLGGMLFAIERTIGTLDIAKKPPKESLEELIDALTERVATRTYTIETNFFSSPNNLKLLDDVAHELSAWLHKHGSKESHRTLRSAIAKFFPAGLHRTWMKDPARFDVLEAALNSPFTASLTRQRESQAYLQYVEEEFTQIRLIGQDEEDAEAVRLAQVFVPLRAYIETGDKKTSAELPRAETAAKPGSEKAKKTKLAVELFSSLEEWIAAADRRDALRIISGGPGVGKSSSMRAFGARLARGTEVFPILIPLQKLERPMSSLRVRIAHYLTTNKAIPFSTSPLDNSDDSHAATPIILIFDGLDELVRPGKDADDIARDFMGDLQRLLDEENGQRGNSRARVIAIVSGRVSATESAARALKCSSEQVLFLIPFLIRNREAFEDPRSLLKNDQRLIWWQLWHKTAPNVPKTMPQSLAIDELVDVTAEPLLLYFVAFVRPWEISTKDGAIDRNWLYDRLLRDFYNRECAKGDRNFATEFSSFAEYEVVLQAMALASWYDGSTRIGSIDIVLKLLRDWDPETENSFKQIIGENKPAIGAALAFYMRPGERPNSFEFLHKTFAEYLVARRIIEAVKSLTKTLTDWQTQGGRRRPLDETSQLLDWLRLMGPKEIDDDVLRFIRGEALKEFKNERRAVESWQASLVYYLKICLRERMPAHLLFQLPDDKYVERPQTFFQAGEHERNAEIALLACLNATILPMLDEPNFSAIDIRPDQSSKLLMGQLITRVRGQRQGPSNLGLRLFAGLDLSSEDSSCAGSVWNACSQGKLRF